MTNLKALLRQLNILPILIVMFAVCVMINPSFAEWNSISALLFEASIFGFLALGEALVVLTGGIDISVGNMASLASVVAVWAMLLLKNILPEALNVPLSILITLVFCGVIGLFTGICVVYLKITPLIATLGTMWVVQGIGYLLLKGVPTPFPYSSFMTLIKGKAFHIPYAFVLLVLIAIVEVFILTKTRNGRHVYAVGGNTYAAYISGVKVNNVKLGVYTMSAILAGVAGILIGAYSSVGSPRLATGYELYAIAAIVMGGIRNGEGNVWNALLAMMTLRIINKIVLFSGLTGYFEGMIVGTILLLTLALNTRESESYVRNLFSMIIKKPMNSPSSVTEAGVKHA